MKRALVFCLLLLLVGFVFADTFTIGTGTSATAVNPFYGSYNFGWCKTIYTASELSTAGLSAGTEITGIGFYVGNTPANYVMDDQRVYIHHTATEVYETTDISYPDQAQFTQHWQGTITFSGSGWFYLTFSTPFEWNGTGNIEFLYENRDGENPTGYPTFRYTSTSTNYRTVYEGSDNEFPSATTGARTYSRANIRIITPSTTIPSPAEALYPLDGGTQVPVTSNLSWNPGIVWPSGYRLSLGTNNPPTNLVDNQDLGNVTSYNPAADFQSSTTYYWKIVPYNTFGDADNCPVWSFTTVGDGTVTTLPYYQHFDAVTAPTLPFDWTAIVQSSSTSAIVATYASTTYAHSQPNCVRLYNPSDASATLILVGPTIAGDLETNGIRVRFWARSSGANYPVSIGVIGNPTDASTYVEVQNLALTTTLTEYTVALTGYTGDGVNIAIKHGLGGTGRSIYVDDITFEQIAANDLACTALTGNTTPSVGNETTYNAAIFNWGTATQTTYTVKLFDAANVELATAVGVTIAPNATENVALNWTPTTQGPWSFMLRCSLPVM